MAESKLKYWGETYGFKEKSLNKLASSSYSDEYIAS